MTRAQSIIGYKKEGRAKNDFYPTPDAATIALLEVEQFTHKVWEPACGDGAISDILFDYGYTVDSADIVDRGYGYVEDFLCVKTLRCPSIVTNPPFIIAEHFIQHAIDLGVKKMALLMRLSALEGMKRSKLLRDTHLTRVHVFADRLTIYQRGSEIGNSGMMAFAWYVWERGYKDCPKLDWITTRKDL